MAISTFEHLTVTQNKSISYGDNSLVKYLLILASAPFIPKNNLGLGLWFENSFLQIWNMFNGLKYHTLPKVIA